MNWGAIGKAINDTILKGKIKPLNKIIEDEEYNTYYRNAIITARAEYPSGSTVFTIVPYGTIEIEDKEYTNSSTEVFILPNTIKRIGELAFSESDVRTVIFPPSVETIEGAAFMDCAQLEEIILPRHITEIKDSTFEGCILGSVDIPESVKYIGFRAFADTDVATVRFTAIPLNIEFNAFYSTAIKHIYMPWSKDEVPGAPWGASQAELHYDTGV